MSLIITKGEIMSKLQLDPYLFFMGNCQEAMEFYKSVFGGELKIQKYDEMPGEKVPNAEGKVMHASLKGGAIDLMASDSTRTEPFGESFISMSIGGEDSELIHNIFDKLSAGGNVTAPIKKESWGDYFGTLTDKFGVDWMVVYGEKQD